MTLVFAKERSLDAIKEALIARRTIVYTGETLAGEEEYARLFFNHCISVREPFYQDDKNAYIEIRNTSDIPFYFVNGPKDAPATISVNPNSVTRVVISKKLNAPLTYDVRNVFIGENEPLKIELNY